MVTTQISREDAESRARIIFYTHLGVYVAVNAGLAYIDLTTNPERTWFFWPMLGWGAGLAAHGVAVFVTHRAADRVQMRVARRAERRERREARQAAKGSR
jgi:hypothetical protein